MPSIANYLRDHITKKGLAITGAALAIGVGAATLRKVLTGRVLPSSRTMSKYARFLKMPMDALSGLVPGSKRGARKGAASRGKADKSGKSGKTGAKSARKTTGARRGAKAAPRGRRASGDGAVGARTRGAARTANRKPRGAAKSGARSTSTR